MGKRRVLLAATVAGLISAVAVSTRAGMSESRSEDWFAGKFNMPSEIAEVTDANELGAFLGDPNRLTRMAAVRRLGQLEGPKAVPELVRRFEKEPYGGFLAFKTYVKREIIRTLEHIGGQEAKAALLDIAWTYLKNGPQLRHEELEYPIGDEDSDYSYVLRNTFDALYNWRDDPNVLAIARQGISLEHLNRSSIVGVAAWELYLAATMASEGKSTQDQYVDYLVDFLIENDLPSRKSAIDPVQGGRTLASMQAEAIANLLRRYDQGALDHADAQVEPDPTFVGTVRGRAVLFVRNRIRDAIKARAESQSSTP